MLTFLSLPLEVRLMVYEYLPWPKQTIIPCNPAARISPLPVELLYTNKTLYNEYRSVFYSHIPFDFTHPSPERVAWFLDKIGRYNTKFIRHIYMKLPTVIGSSIDTNCDLILERILKDCTGLRKISLDFVGYDDLSDLQKQKREDPKAFTELLRLLDERFRKIGSVETIFVEYVENTWKNQWDDIFLEMNEFGWEVGYSGNFIYVDSEDEDYQSSREGSEHNSNLPDEYNTAEVDPFADTCLGDRGVV